MKICRRRGLLIGQAGHFAEALEKFDKAYRTYPSPTLLLNLSRTELKLGQCDEAIRYAQIYLTDTGKGASARERESWFAKVQAECVGAEITSTPAGATITIVGVPSASPATTPWQGRLLVGDHPLTGKAGGIRRSPRDIDGQRGEAASGEHQARSRDVCGASTPAGAGARDCSGCSRRTEGAEADSSGHTTHARSACRHPTADGGGQASPHGPDEEVLHTLGWVAVAVGGAALVTAGRSQRIVRGDRSQHRDRHVLAQRRSGRESTEQREQADGAGLIQCMASGTVLAVTGFAFVDRVLIGRDESGLSSSCPVRRAGGA